MQVSAAGVLCGSVAKFVESPKKVLVTAHDVFPCELRPPRARHHHRQPSVETRPFAHHTGSMGEPSSSSDSVATKLQALFGGGKKKRGFASGAVPFLFLLALGSWGLSQFLKMPVRAKDEARRRKKEGREKFSLEKEKEKMSVRLDDSQQNYENKRIPGPRPKGRVAAD